MRLALVPLLVSLAACVPSVTSQEAVIQPTVRWVGGASDHMQTVGTTRIVEVLEGAPDVRYFVSDMSTPGAYRVDGFRDAGDGGLDWTLIGSGETSGWAAHQLWLVEAPVVARTSLAVPSDAVAFMMAGDHNDGFATFAVDGVMIGTFDMLRRRDATLVVEGLPFKRHVLEVRLDGRQGEASLGVHVALWGGSALVRDTSWTP